MAAPNPEKVLSIPQSFIIVVLVLIGLKSCLFTRRLGAGQSDETILARRITNALGLEGNVRF